MERPILFSAPMVRAILDGSKTQTRRAIKWTRNRPVDFVGSGTEGGPDWNNPACWGYPCDDGSFALLRPGSDLDDHTIPCPYGQPEDSLWVRETFMQESFFVPCAIRYRATDEPCVYGDPIGNLARPWMPSIHMPRWASRINLEVTGVRVERLQDISEADAIAEGIEKTPSGFWSLYGQSTVDGTYSPRASYRALWESINGPDRWDENPWVWAITFKVIK